MLKRLITSLPFRFIRIQVQFWTLDAYAEPHQRPHCVCVCVWMRSMCSFRTACVNWVNFMQLIYASSRWLCAVKSTVTGRPTWTTNTIIYFFCVCTVHISHSVAKFIQFDRKDHRVCRAIVTLDCYPSILHTRSYAAAAAAAVRINFAAKYMCIHLMRSNFVFLFLFSF